MNLISITNYYLKKLTYLISIAKYFIIDIALVCLKRNEIFQRVSPSKIFEACAMSKSILFGVAGDSKSLVNIYKAGVFLALKIIKLLKKLKFIKK